jgi:NUDIX domain
MIKRVNKGRHAGQWAFPGGVVEAGERAAPAALREAFEEVGLERADVVGPLDDILTGTGFIITPVVMFAATASRLKRNADEVHSLHRVGLTRLVAAGMPRWVRDDSGHELLQYPLRHDMVVYPPTGAILWQFAEVALRGQATRVADLTQPAFATQPELARNDIDADTGSMRPGGPSSAASPLGLRVRVAQARSRDRCQQVSSHHRPWPCPVPGLDRVGRPPRRVIPELSMLPPLSDLPSPRGIPATRPDSPGPHHSPATENKIHKPAAKPPYSPNGRRGVNHRG